MFEGEEYRTYLQLCRELRLPWRWQEGDWYWHPGDGLVEPFVGHCRDRWLNPDVAEKAVPLPRLDQWLEKLEEAGIDSVQFFRTGVGGHVVARSWERNGVMRRDPWVGDTRTHEESAARLWMALTGRTVTR